MSLVKPYIYFCLLSPMSLKDSGDVFGKAVCCFFVVRCVSECVAMYLVKLVLDFCSPMYFEALGDVSGVAVT